MDVGNWQVHIHRPMNRFGADLTIFRRVGGKTEVLEIGGLGQVFVKEMLQDGTIKQSTMRIDSEEDVRGILTAFVAVAAKLGIQRPEGAFAEGKLEAVEEHLVDMRRLVFKDEVK